MMKILTNWDRVNVQGAHKSLSNLLDMSCTAFFQTRLISKSPNLSFYISRFHSSVSDSSIPDLDGKIKICSNPTSLKICKSSMADLLKSISEVGTADNPKFLYQHIQKEWDEIPEEGILCFSRPRSLRLKNGLWINFGMKRKSQIVLQLPSF